MRRASWLTALIVLVVVLLFGSRLLQLYVDWLWFGELGQQVVLRGIWGAQILLGLVAAVVMFAVLYVNIWLARRVSPPLTPRYEDFPMRVRVGRLARTGLNWGLLAAAAGLAVVAGLFAATQWVSWLLFLHAVPFKQPDPLFGKDIGFYVFTLPFWRLLYSWVFLTLAAGTLAAGLVYYMDRAIVVLQSYARVASSARVHLSVLLGLLALVKAWGYRLDAYSLLFSVSDVLVGAGYTDVHARLVSLDILMVLAVVAAIGFFVNAYYRVLWLPAAALGVMVVSSLTVGVAYPWAVQQFQVQPNQLRLEAPYIRRHIEATRAAYGLGGTQVKPFTPQGSLTVADLREQSATIQNIRLWDYRPLLSTYQQLQALYNYYRFTNVDIDRYRLDGRDRQVMLSVRELNPMQLPPDARTWVNQTLVYTHGYGLVMSPVNEYDANGRPTFFIRDMPVVTHPDLPIQRPQLYFGERPEADVPVPDVIVRSRVPEFDYPAGGTNQTTRYEGKLGIPIGSAFRRSVFATVLGDTNLLISSAISPESRLLYRREIRERAATLAPFLRFDGDPYAVVAGGRVFWIHDAYTTTENYPYSAPFLTAQANALGGAYARLDDTDSAGFNYIRNSVKVVTDAYEGTVSFYVADPTDPIVQAYSAIFPGLFQEMARMPIALASHVRYPEDFFRIQSQMFALYHVTDPGVFYRREDVWSIPTEKLSQSEGTQAALLQPGQEGGALGLSSSQETMEPYYVIMRLPGERKEEFLLMLPFTYRGRPNMSAWLCARCDGKEYGRLLVYVFPQGNQREGPQQVESLINQDPSVSQQLSLWNTTGSKVQWGNLLVIPIDHSILYVRPLFLVASAGGIPELKRVVLVHEGRVAMEATLAAALNALFGEGAAEAVAGAPTARGRPLGALPSGRRAGGTPALAGAAAPASGGTARALADQAGRALDEALAAQRRGDWAAYGAALKRLESAVRALQQATGSQR
jgi:uncharacterized protein